jgi:4a-hydroxytetrahydrobiopterin dehydratase
MLSAVTAPDPNRALTRSEASQAVEAIGWRYLLGTLCASIPVLSLTRAAAVAVAAVDAAGGDADDHLRVDLRPERVELSVQTRAQGALTSVDVDVAHRVTNALRGLDLSPAPARSQAYFHPVAMLELAIDAIDIAAVRPFWKAVLDYVDDPADPGPEGAIIDPAGQQPAVWFQAMGRARDQRNRIHLDITVAHDEAAARVQAALDAGGRLVNDSYARMFWVLADAEGNECCVCTWTDRDDWNATHPDPRPNGGDPGAG